MLTFRKIAVTGNIASGKSTVCRIFQELGAYVTDADAIVHQLLDPSTRLGQQIVELLGEDVVVGKRFDKEKIAQKVFSDHSLLEKLERLIHPEVRRELNNQYNQVSQKHYPLFVAEIPLLFEAGFDKDFDGIIYIDAAETHCRERFTGDFEKRKKRLWPEAEKKAKSDWVIENNANLEKLRHQVVALFNEIKG